MLLAFQLLDLGDFGPILENVVDKGPAGDPAGDPVFARPREEKRKGRPEPEDLALSGPGCSGKTAP